LPREPGGRYFICSCSEGLAGPVVVDWWCGGPTAEGSRVRPEATRVHHAARRRGRSLAARGATRWSS